MLRMAFRGLLNFLVGVIKIFYSPIHAILYFFVYLCTTKTKDLMKDEEDSDFWRDSLALVEG